MGEVFETTDVELAEDLLLRHYGTSVRIRAHGPQSGMRLAQAVLTPAVRFEYSHLAVNFTATAGPRLSSGRTPTPTSARACSTRQVPTGTRWSPPMQPVSWRPSRWPFSRTTR